MKYKKGDLVRIADNVAAAICHHSLPAFVPAVGTEGVIDDPSTNGALVLWCGEHGCERDRTWVTNDVLEPARSFTPAQDAMKKYEGKEKIIIYRDGRSVFAKDTSTGKIAEAKCSPEDEFDFHFGAALAFARVTGARVELDTPAPPKLYNGKVVCVEKELVPFIPGEVTWWTVGKIYPVVEGVIFDNDGVPRKAVRSLGELNNVVGPAARFVALVE